VLTRRDLRLRVQVAITVLAGVTVESPGDWESTPSSLPSVKLRAPAERKVSKGRLMPEFDTTVSMELLARVAGRTEREAQDAIDDLCDRLERAVLGAPQFIEQLQQVSMVDTRVQITATAERHFGEAHMMFACETFEVFDAIEIDPSLADQLKQMLLTLDTIGPFDPGTLLAERPASVVSPANAPLAGVAAATGQEYANPAYPDAVVPAPRKSGPDGRAEAVLQIDLPT